MSFLNKLGKGLNKLGSFTGKVLKGVAQGGIAGGIATGLTNLGPGTKSAETKAQKESFTTRLSNLSNTNPDRGDYILSSNKTTEEEKKKKTIMYVIGGVIVAVLLFLLTKKRR